MADYRDHRLGQNALNGVSNCPHCGVASPVLTAVWHSQHYTARSDGNLANRWSAFACTTCGGVITARGKAGDNVTNPLIEKIFPDIKFADHSIPERARSFLDQAYRTKTSADASVVMSASAIDAMLKHFDLKDGSLYERIASAVSSGLLAKSMGDWAHQVRLDANKPRHADESVGPMTAEDADRAYDFAETIAEFLFVLPSRMPKTQ